MRPAVVPVGAGDGVVKSHRRPPPELGVMEYNSQHRLDFINDLHNCDLHVLDDLLTTPITQETSAELLNTLAARDGREYLPWSPHNLMNQIGIKPSTTQ